MSLTVKNCTGAGQYAFTGSVETDAGVLTGVCPECDTRQEVNLDGFILAHQLPPLDVQDQRKGNR